MSAFDYPSSPHVRRHGRQGYRTYAGYRDWLRDESRFRCVYCLSRELWSKRLAGFHIDHFVPLVVDPSREGDYDNLLYVCASCNALKGIVLLPNPCEMALGDCLQVHPDGTIESLNEQGRLIVDVLRLNGDENTSYRRRMLRILRVAERFDRELYLD